MVVAPHRDCRRAALLLAGPQQAGGRNHELSWLLLALDALQEVVAGAEKR